MSENIILTIKTNYEGDIRRFSLTTSVDFNFFCNQIMVIYGLHTKPFVVKYLDDENDWVNVTTDEELHEAFRLSQTLHPPVLRVSVHEVSNGVGVNFVRSTASPLQKQKEQAIPLKEEPTTIVLCNKIEEEEEEEEENKNKNKEKEKEEKVYPSLPINEWDAPCKENKNSIAKIICKEMKVIPVVKTSSSSSSSLPSLLLINNSTDENKPLIDLNQVLKLTMKAQLQLDCDDTRKDVDEYSRRGLGYAMEYFTSPNVSLCSDLSKKIADECQDLSHKTAELCQQLCTLQGKVSAEDGQYNPVLATLATKTEQECRRLSEETTAICKALSKETITNSQQKKLLEEELEAKMKEQALLSQLSKMALDECDRLTKETSESTSRLSAEISSMIMSL